MEIAAYSNKSEKSFQTYIRTFYKVPNGVEKLTGITMEKCLQEGVLLNPALRGLNAFIGSELDSPCEAIKIVSHGGAEGDFPLLVLAIEKTFGDGYITELDCISRASFIDSMLESQYLGYPKQGIAGLTTKFGMELPTPHSAAGDAGALKQVCLQNEKIVFGDTDRTTIQDLLHKAWDKLPLSLANVFTLAAETCSDGEFINELTRFSGNNTALKPRLIEQIIMHYKRKFRVYRSNDFLTPDLSLWTRQPTLQLCKWMGSQFGNGKLKSKEKEQMKQVMQE